MNREIRETVVSGIGTLSKAEAAEVLGISPTQVDKLRQCGLLRAVKPGQAWRYSQDELKSFMADLAGVDVSSPELMVKALPLRSRGSQRTV